MKVIGITGPSGSGKSSVVKLLGLKTVDADKIAREVVHEGGQCLRKLCQLFGDDILNSDGTLNRKALAQKAFSSKENTDKLNAVTHPFITIKINEVIDNYILQGEHVVILDAPQLFEARCQNICDKVIGVIADEKIRKERIMKRDSLSEDQAILRITAGKSNEFFIKNCDYIIENNGSEEELKDSVRTALIENKEILL